MYYVYLIENAKGKIYTGYTSDLNARIERHNSCEGRGWSKKNGPWKLIYSENFPTKKEAMERERRLESLKAGQRIKIILDIHHHVPL